MTLSDIQAIARGLLGLLGSPSVSIFWLYLAGAAVLGAVSLWVRARGRWGVRRILIALFGPRVWWRRSVAHDAGLLVLNTVAYSLLWAVPLQAASDAIATWVWAGLHGQLGPMSVPLHGVPLHVLATGIIFVAADLGFFLAHLALHRVPWLWAFHKVHHSAEVLVPLTVFRRHPVDILFEGLVSGTVLGVAYGGLAYLAGYVPSGYLIAGVNAVFFVVVLAGFNLQHANVWLSFGPLDRLFISPAAHQIHHSRAPEHADRNFGNLLSIWDRVLGTYTSVSNRHRPALRFGVGGGASGHSTVLGLYVTPFLDVARGLRDRIQKLRNASEPRGTDTA